MSYLPKFVQMLVGIATQGREWVETSQQRACRLQQEREHRNAMRRKWMPVFVVVYWTVSAAVATILISQLHWELGPIAIVAVVIFLVLLPFVGRLWEQLGDLVALVAAILVLVSVVGVSYRLLLDRL